MAFKLTKDERATRTKLLVSIKTEWEKLEDAKAFAEDQMRAALEKMNESIESFKTALSEIEGFREDVASRLRSEWDEKSERWQDGDTGQEAHTFVEAWESAIIEITDMSVETPDIDISDAESNIGDFEDLPEE